MRDSIKINVKELEHELRRRGITLSEASREMGFRSNYFGNIKNRGYLPKTTILLLDKLYGIKEEQYSAEKKEEPKAEEKPVEIDYDKLYEVVYSAVYQAMKMAWKEC